jgi:DNA-3-methyladenine glycosylase I
MLILEGAQAGLSWITILRKRENYRRAFDSFNAGKMARYSGRKIEALLSNPGIVRNKLKINAAISNARAYLDILDSQGSFSGFIWQFVDGHPRINHWRSLKQVPASTDQSDAMSRELKKRGFKFVGSTICYAYMQAIGMVNDHLVNCPQHRNCQR